MTGMACSERELRGMAKGVILCRDAGTLDRASSVGATRILCLSDLHIPFNLPIEQIRGVGRVDVLVLNGDIVDCYALSKFPKEYHLSPVDEMIKAREYLIDLINAVKPKRVIANYGNHEARFASYLKRNISEDMRELLPDTPLDYIFDRGFTRDNKQTGVSTYYAPISTVFQDIEIFFTHNWWTRVGKTVFAHPLAYSAQALKTADKMVAFLHATVRDPFDAVVIGHTHRSAEGKHGYIHVYEQGAMCDVNAMRYADGKLQQPMQKGYVLIVQDEDGNIIPDSSKRYVIE